VDDIIFFYNGQYSGINFATKDRLRLNLLTYRKVGQNLNFILLNGIILTISKLLANNSKSGTEKFDD